MDTFQKRLEASRALTRALHSFDIDLSIAANDKEYAIAGNLFYVLHSPLADDYIEIRLNEIDNPRIMLLKMLGLRAYHERVFITTPAGQTGNMTILHGKVDPELFAVIDNRSVSSATMDAIRDELRGDTTVEDWGTEKTIGFAAVEILAANADRKGWSCQAKSTNTGLIYVGFDNTVTSAKWWAELQAGVPCGMEDYRGAVFAIASLAGQLVGWGEW